MLSGIRLNRQFGKTSLLLLLLLLVSFSALKHKRSRLPSPLTGRINVRCSQMHVGGLCRSRSCLAGRNRTDQTSNPPHLTSCRRFIEVAEKERLNELSILITSLPPSQSSQWDARLCWGRKQRTCLPAPRFVSVCPWMLRLQPAPFVVRQLGSVKVMC